MPPKKTATLNLRIDPGVKEALRVAAEVDNRSIANMVETLIKNHCEKHGIAILQQESLFDERKNE